MSARGATSQLVTVQVEKVRALLADVRTMQEAREVLDQAEAMRVFLRRQEASLAVQADAAAITQYAMRRLGELCREMPSSQGHRSDKQLSSANGKKFKGELLRELDIAPTTAHRWEKLAEPPDEEFAARVEQLRAKIMKVEGSGVAATSAAAGYDGDESYTPAKYIELVREVLGEIDLDPASCEVAQKIVRAKHWFSKQQNGLGRPWMAKAVWLNSPYSFPAVGDFQGKFVGDHAARYFAAGLTLVNNATETAWFQQLLKHFPVCFPDHRISFVNAQGFEMTQNRQGQAFFYAGPKLPLFRRTFGQIGKVMVPA